MEVFADDSMRRREGWGQAGGAVTPTGATRLGENPNRGGEAFGPRNAQERTWAVVDAVQAAAEQHIKTDELAFVLVGDADAILPGLEGAAIGPIVVDREELPAPEASANG